MSFASNGSVEPTTYYRTDCQGLIYNDKAHGITA